MSKTVRISSRLSVDRIFFEFLSNSNNIISRIILHGETLPGINFISSTEKIDMISYLPDNKFKNEYGFDPFDKNIGRTYLKVGRLVSKIIPDNYIKEYTINDATIESFVNSYKSWFDNSENELRIVEGDDILKWYNERNYFITETGNRIGTLWASCMRQEERQKYLELYKYNNVKMLVLLVKVGGVEKVKCRALLWDNVKSFNQEYSNIKIMDRIYSVFDSDVDTFKRWADENGYICKWEQNSKSHQYFNVKGDVIKLKCEIKLDKKNLDYYPYLDTFPFFDFENGILFNDEFSSHDYKLTQANGRLEPTQHEEEPLHEDEMYDDLAIYDDD